MSKSSWGVVVSAVFALASAIGLPFDIPQPSRHAISVVAFTILVFALLGWAIAHIEWLNPLRAPQHVNTVILLIVFIATGMAGTGLFLLTRPSEGASAKQKQFSEMTNTELRVATQEFVNRLRKFNAEFKHMNGRLLDQEQLEVLRAKEEAEKERIWHRNSEQSSERQRNFQAAFHAHFFVQAGLLENVLNRRVDPAALIGIGSFSKRPTALKADGLLVGVDPVEDVANYLEALSEQLPSTPPSPTPDKGALPP